MARLLIISFAYWPLTSARALRWTTVAETLARDGHAVDVITAWQVGLPTDEWRNGVHLFRPHGGTLTPVGQLIRKVVGGGATGLPGTMPTGRGRRHSSLPRRVQAVAEVMVKWTHDHTWRQVRWPDYACLWIWPALRAARRLSRSARYDALITVSHPFSGHVVGLCVHDQVAARWLVDIGDPWSFSPGYPMNNDRLYRRLNVAVERRVFSAADVVSVTHPAAKEAYAALYREAASKLHVVPPVAAMVLVPDVAAPLAPGCNVRLAYVGSFYRTIRSPRFLLDLLARLWATPAGGRAELHLFGPLNDCEDLVNRSSREHPNRIVVHGKVPPAVAQRAMQDADILVNVGNLTTYQLPSKLVEYMAAGKPILNAAYHESDSSAGLLEQYPAALTVFESQAVAGRDYLPELLAFVQNPPSLDDRDVDQWRRRFGPEAISAQYLALATG